MGTILLFIKEYSATDIIFGIIIGVCLPVIEQSVTTQQLGIKATESICGAVNIFTTLSILLATLVIHEVTWYVVI